MSQTLFERTLLSVSAGALMLALVPAPVSAQLQIQNEDVTIKFGIQGQFWADWTQNATAASAGAQGYAQNYYLLRALGEIQKPILLKRGMSATIEELLLSAEYIMSGGNYNVILCERGIRTFDTYMRNTMDIAAIPVIKQLSHLPVMADPSHGTGRRDKVAAMARAAVAAGADGLLIEVHENPERALSDGAQSLYPDQFDEVMDEVRMIAPAVGRKIAGKMLQQHVAKI